MMTLTDDEKGEGAKAFCHYCGQELPPFDEHKHLAVRYACSPEYIHEHNQLKDALEGAQRERDVARRRVVELELELKLQK